MRKLLAVVYTSLALGANAAMADVASLRAGEMQKLTFAAQPAAVPDLALTRMDEGETSLAAYRGQWLLVNFWATWCAPCRKEMPSLDRLQAQMPELKVIALASGRNDPPLIKRFFEEAEIAHIETLRDPKSALSRAMAVMALPVTVIIDPEGREVARLIGDAEWDSADAQTILRAMMAQP